MLKSLLDRLVQAALSDKTRPRKVQWALFGFIVVPVLLVATISSMQTYKDLTKAVLARREAFASLAAATLKERIDRLMDLGLSLGHPAPGPPAGRGRSMGGSDPIPPGHPQEFPCTGADIPGGPGWDASGGRAGPPRSLRGKFLP